MCNLCNSCSYALRLRPRLPSWSGLPFSLLSGDFSATLWPQHEHVFEVLAKRSTMLCPQEPIVTEDPIQLQQFIQNLVLNGMEPMAGVINGKRKITASTR